MASREQIEANRKNAQKSTGPRNTDLTRFNGLKHGLRAEQHVLPGEDPDAFRAEVDAWFDDWRPKSHTRARLTERAAIASWRLLRATASESAFRARLADDAGRAFDNEVAGRVERAAARMEHEPMAALSLLESHAAGIDRVLASWGLLVEAVKAGPAGWNQPLYHQRLLVLMGYRANAVAIESGPVHVASSRLLHSHVPGPGGRVLPLSEADACAAFEEVRRTVESELARLRDLRERAPDPSEGRRRAMMAAAADTSREALLMHRYEMAHEASLRAAIRQLLALERSGADLPDPPEDEPEAPPEPGAQAVAAPARPESPEKQDVKRESSGSCGRLASVGVPAPAGVAPGPSAGSPGGAGRPSGSGPGPKTAPKQR
jgi:hypothetical protein